MNNAQNKFIKYVRTKMIFSLRFRNIEDEMKPVHISSNEIAERFFPYPEYNRNREMQALHDAGEIRITKNGKAFYYEALKPGGYDLNLLPVKEIQKDTVTQRMLKNIQKVTLEADAPSTPYFDLFLKYRLVRPELFFKVDEFCGRIHTPISNFHRTHRPNLLIDNDKTTSLDVATMQPLLLGKLLFKAIGDNEYSTWINEGKDIYIELQNKACLNSRDEAKKKFFEILFSKPNDTLKIMFGVANWINWINNYKQLDEPLNPHCKDKPHSNLAWLLQSTEVSIMRQVWTKLVDHNLPFLSVHDEIIVKVTDYLQAKEIFENILSYEFEYYKLNTKEPFSPVTLAINTPIVNSEGIKTPFKDSEPIPPETHFKPFSKEFTPLWDITELEAYFKALQLTGQTIKVNQFSTIVSVKNFIDSHFKIVKHNNGNPTYLPYLTRLQEVKECLEKL